MRHDTDGGYYYYATTAATANYARRIFIILLPRAVFSTAPRSWQLLLPHPICLAGAVAGTVRGIGGVLPYSYSGTLSINAGEYVFNPGAGFESGSVMSAIVRDGL